MVLAGPDHDEIRAPRAGDVRDDGVRRAEADLHIGGHRSAFGQQSRDRRLGLMGEVRLEVGLVPLRRGRRQRRRFDDVNHDEPGTVLRRQLNGPRQHGVAAGLEVQSRYDRLHGLHTASLLSRIV